MSHQCVQSLPTYRLLLLATCVIWHRILGNQNEKLRLSYCLIIARELYHVTYVLCLEINWYVEMVDVYMLTLHPIIKILLTPGSAFIKRDQLDPWIKDQLRNALLSTILSLQLPNFVSCGRACPSHMTQNLVTVGVKLLIGEWFLFDPWSMDQADLVW